MIKNYLVIKCYFVTKSKFMVRFLDLTSKIWGQFGCRRVYESFKGRRNFREIERNWSWPVVVVTSPVWAFDWSKKPTVHSGLLTMAHSGPHWSLCPQWSTVQLHIAQCLQWSLRTKCTALATVPTFNGTRAKFYFHTKFCPQFTPGIWQPSPHSWKLGHRILGKTQSILNSWLWNVCGGSHWFHFWHF